MGKVLISAAAGFAAFSFVWLAAAPAEAATEQVEVSNLYFCDPSFENGVCTTTITAGDTVKWDVALGVHTVTECDATYAKCSSGFDSSLLAPGATFSQTFPTAGSYPYKCAVHPIEMRGVVTVFAATDAPTPSPTPTDSPTATPTPTPSPTAGPEQLPPTPPPTAGPELLPPTGDGSVPADGSLLGLLLIIGGAVVTIGAGLFGLALRRRTSPHHLRQIN